MIYSTPILLLALASLPAGPSGIRFKEEQNAIRVFMGEREFGVFVFKDHKVLRPYFMHLRAPNGFQVTRTHPPVAGKDDVDHATMHPGAWLAFGDINGHDTWRNKARVVHEKWEPVKETLFADRAHFKVHSKYLPKDSDTPFAREETLFTFIAAPMGHIVLWDTKIHPLVRDFTCGDEEEMGLGIRVATPLAVKNGGRILNSDGKQNEKAVRGTKPKWCEYSKGIDGQRVGVALLVDHSNFRESHFHVRDYGLMVANPFGINTFTKQPSNSPIMHPPNSYWRLRYAIVTFSTAENRNAAAEAYRFVFP